MNSNNKGKDYDYFGDDFEVTYDGDLPDISDFTDDNYEVDDDDVGDYDDEPNRRRPSSRPKDKGKKSTERRPKEKKPKKRRKMPNFLSPLKKSAKFGGKAAGKLLQTIMRAATLILIAVIMILIAVNFWKGHSVYGDPVKLIDEKNYALGTYLGVGVFLLLFELIAFFRALTSEKIQTDRRRRRLDTGRGITSFIIIYIGSYIAFLSNTMLPESPAAIEGLKGALLIYGSMSNTLLALCIAGVISCLIRKYSSR